MTKKKTRKKTAPKPMSLHRHDEKAKWVITYSFHAGDTMSIDTALHEGTLTEFLIEANSVFTNPSIVYPYQVTDAQFESLQKAMDMVEEVEVEEDWEPGILETVFSGEEVGDLELPFGGEDLEELEA
jgi:hypothetical protein